MSGMFDDWRRNRAAKRVKPGTGRPLKPFRWWQLLTRSLFYIRLAGEDGLTTVYAVEVRHMGNKETGVIEAHLYRDNIHQALSKTPAKFPVPGGTIEVETSSFGLKRCHYVTEDGAERQLEPDPKSAEGRRARLDQAHPTLSRVIGVVSVVLLVVGVFLLIPQIIEPISEIPPIADNIGTFTSPIQLSFWPNVIVTLVFIAASTERALRLRYRWWLDGAAN